MLKLKMGRKDKLRESAKRFEKIYKQPLSKRIVDFLKEESNKEKEQVTDKKIAQNSNRQRDLDI
ncbi:MAG: hypothetical protein M9899_10695 [Bdellovibrionaceae bacterium]|nr:hypothetical protein [Pseudobdellovibrionaceae bacterium]